MFCLVLSYLVLFGLIASCLILSCLFVSCLVFFSTVVYFLSPLIRKSYPHRLNFSLLFTDLYFPAHTPLPYHLFSLGITHQNYVDVGLSALRYDKTLKKTGLIFLENFLFECNVLKPKKVQMSNWERDVLTEAQVRYAVYDALMGRHIYDYLQKEGKSKLRETYRKAVICLS